tara:strand:+ start:632 stop:1264 length:633 start_codon:yes stop_codon:yes gene_type:complete
METPNPSSWQPDVDWKRLLTGSRCADFVMPEVAAATFMPAPEMEQSPLWTVHETTGHKNLLEKAMLTESTTHRFLEHPDNGDPMACPGMGPWQGEPFVAKSNKQNAANELMYNALTERHRAVLAALMQEQVVRMEETAELGDEIARLRARVLQLQTQLTKLKPNLQLGEVDSGTYANAAQTFLRPGKRKRNRATAANDLDRLQPRKRRRV